MLAVDRRSLLSLPPLTGPRVFALAVGITIYILAGVLFAADTSLTFVALVQSNPGSLHSEYYTVQMFAVGSSGLLDGIWSTESAEISTVRVFPEVNSLLIEQVLAAWGGLRVIALSDRHEVAQIDLTEGAFVSASYQYATDKPFGQIEFRLQSRDDRKEQSSVRISPSRVSPTVRLSSEQAQGELRLAGLTLYGFKQDFVPFLNVTKPPVESRANVSGIAADAFPVPESVIVFRNSWAWTLFAHEPTFLALRSAPNGTHEESEMLIYSRLDSSWRSVLVPGDANTAWAVNGWISGQVIHANPNNDYTTHRGFPSDITNSVYLLNPQTLKLVVVDLASRGEVLWVESDTVYYRSGTSLFKARIGDSDLVDRQLILTDPRVRDIHWAFRPPTSDTDN